MRKFSQQCSRPGGSAARPTRLTGLGLHLVSEVLRIIGEESRKKGTDKLTSRQIDQAIKAARAEKSKRG